jgi:hypothetical protein
MRIPNFIKGIAAGRSPLVEAVVAVLTLGTVNVSSLQTLLKSLPKRTAMGLIAVLLIPLSLTTYNGWSSVMTSVFGHRQPAEPQQLSYFTDPACQHIITDAENALFSCGAYISVLEEDREFGSQTTSRQFRPGTLRQCVTDTGDLLQEVKDDGNNIPQSAQYQLQILLEDVKSFGRTLVFTPERDIPSRIGSRKDAYENSVRSLRVACRMSAPAGQQR